MAGEQGRVVIDVIVKTDALKKGAAATQKFEGQVKRTSKSIGVLKGATSDLRSATVNLVGAYLGFQGIKGIISLTNQYQGLRNQTLAMSGSQDEFNSLFSSFTDIALATNTALDVTIGTFRTLERLTPELGQSQEQSEQFVTTLNQLAQIGGASAAATSASLRQLSQGLAGGVLRAEEFNSVVENTPEIANALADGLGVSLGGLRKLVLEGEVLSKDVFGAILSQAEKTNAAFIKLPKTFGQFAQNIKTASIALAGTLNEYYGKDGLVSKALENIGLTLQLVNDFYREEVIAQQTADITPLRQELEAIDTLMQNQNLTITQTGNLLARRLELEKEIRGIIGEQTPKKTSGGAATNASEINDFTSGEVSSRPQRGVDTSDVIPLEERFAAEQEELVVQAEYWTGYADSVVGSLQTIADAQYEIAIQSYNDAANALDTAKKREQRAIEKLARAKTDIDKREAKAELKKAQLATKEAERKKKEEESIARAAFEQKKKVDALTILAATATGIANVWKVHAANPVAAGILTGITVAATAAQLSLVNSQKFPARQFGGLVRAGEPTQINEAGIEQYVVGSKRMAIFPTDGRIAPSTGGGSTGAGGGASGMVGINFIDQSSGVSIASRMREGMLEIIATDRDVGEAIDNSQATRVKSGESLTDKEIRNGS